MKLSPAVTRLFSHRGSTRSLALLRLGLVAVVWADKAPTLTVFRLHQLGVEMAITLPLVVAFYAGTIFLFVGLWSRRASAGRWWGEAAFLCSVIGGVLARSAYSAINTRHCCSLPCSCCRCRRAAA